MVWQITQDLPSKLWFFLQKYRFFRHVRNMVKNTEIQNRGRPIFLARLVEFWSSPAEEKKKSVFSGMERAANLDIKSNKKRTNIGTENTSKGRVSRKPSSACQLNGLN